MVDYNLKRTFNLAEESLKQEAGNEVQLEKLRAMYNDFALKQFTERQKLMRKCEEVIRVQSLKKKTQQEFKEQLNCILGKAKKKRKIENKEGPGAVALCHSKNHKKERKDKDLGNN